MEKRFKTLKRITFDESEKYISSDEDFLNNVLCYYTLISLDDGWDKVDYFTKRNKRSVPTDGKGDELIYVLSNPTYPGLLKIGYTRKEIGIRINDLSKASGVPTKFKLEYTFKCFNGKELESEIHTFLKEYRPNNQREFFEIDLKKAIESVKNVGKNYI